MAPPSTGNNRAAALVPRLCEDPAIFPDRPPGGRAVGDWINVSSMGGRSFPGTSLHWIKPCLASLWHAAGSSIEQGRHVMNRSYQEEQDLIEVYTRAEVVASIVWLHGLGVGGSDMDGLITNMHRSRELGLHHLAPHAPLRRISVNNGRPARAWYDVLGDPAEVPQDEAGIDDSSRRITRLLNAERQRGIPSEHTVLGGFSQGGAMALHCGLRYPQPLGGIVVLSGELLLPERLADERHPANAKTPILMIHGTDDKAVPLADAARSRDHLRALGYGVEWVEFPAGHTVPMDAVATVDAWVHDILARPASTS